MESKSDTMSAMCWRKYGDASVVKIEQLPIPKPGPMDVLIQAHAASLNPIDFKRRGGAMKALNKEPVYPVVMGYDVSGVVSALGSGLDASCGFAVGDAVFARIPSNSHGQGTCCEFVVAEVKSVAKKPTNLTHAEAASIPLAGLTALKALRRARLDQGQKVFMTAGAGGVGTIALQLAKKVYGAATVATTTSPAGTELCRSLGADVTVDYKTEHFEQKLTDYDVAFDMTGEVPKCLQILKRGGRCISVVEPVQKASLVGAGFQVGCCLGCILGCMANSVEKQARERECTYEHIFMDASGKDLTELAGYFESGTLRPVVDRVFPFPEALQALAHLESNKAKGKVVIQIVA